MTEWIYTVETNKSVDEAVQAVEAVSARHGFRVLHTHDVQAALAEKGFAQQPLKIVEICNAKAAHAVLSREPRIAVMLPCPIAVYREAGRTVISTLLPTAMATMFPNKGLEPIAEEVERSVLEILAEAKQ
ncbi:MAG: DUF302 domain-containing protein [Firmicutes bacterium]|nr:DUF302 domain-containing protein [Bacillota bacterium]